MALQLCARDQDPCNHIKMMAALTAQDVMLEARISLLAAATMVIGHLPLCKQSFERGRKVYSEALMMAKDMP